MGTNTLHKVRVLVWGESTETAAEHKLVQKIYFFILVCTVVEWEFLRTDSNLADVSLLGRKKSDRAHGQVPHALAIHVISPRIWFPSMIIFWSGLTMCMAACKNFT
ncbi:hypothetical protein BDZ45DRAFT_755347 [Acephala macrosclerotiorum]|nr:hypothetical protein BDZ45DRAFT_755347 [Acephala macrosclerotiorum]